MAKFAVEYSYNEAHWGDTEVEAEDLIAAEYEALNIARDLHPEASGLNVTDIKEVV